MSPLQIGIFLLIVDTKGLFLLLRGEFSRMFQVFKDLCADSEDAMIVVGRTLRACRETR